MHSANRVNKHLLAETNEEPALLLWPSCLHGPHGYKALKSMPVGPCFVLLASDTEASFDLMIQAEIVARVGVSFCYFFLPLSCEWCLSLLPFKWAQFLLILLSTPSPGQLQDEPQNHTVCRVFTLCQQRQHTAQSMRNWQNNRHTEKFCSDYMFLKWDNSLKNPNTPLSLVTVGYYCTVRNSGFTCLQSHEAMIIWRLWYPRWRITLVTIDSGTQLGTDLEWQWWHLAHHVSFVLCELPSSWQLNC